MTEKRFTDDGFEAIEEQSFTDNLTGKTYWIDNGLDEIVELLNKLHEENKELRLLVNTLKEQNMKFKLRLKDLGVDIYD